MDEREVKETHLLQSINTDESLRPILYTYKYPVPGDSIVPLSYPLVIDIEKRELIYLDIPPLISFVAGIWTMVLGVIGLTQLQKLSTGRAIGAVLVSVIIPLIIAVAITIWAATAMGPMAQTTQIGMFNIPT